VILHYWLVLWARQLQVERPRRLRQWLWRLFVLPPRGRPPITIQSADVPNPVSWLAWQLGISPRTSACLWPWYLLVLPNDVGRARVRAVWRSWWRALWGLSRALAWPLRWVLRWGSPVVGWGLSVSIKLILLPLRVFMATLDRIGHHLGHSRLGATLDRGITPLLRIPGLRPVLLALSAVAAAVVVTTPFNWVGQLMFLLLCWATSLTLRRMPGRFPSLALAAIGLIAMGRYAWWRLTTTLNFDSTLEAVLGSGLLLAEAYTWLVVVLGFIQTAYPLQRQPASLPPDNAEWPTVDVFIPTYNEPLSVVRPTTLAALSLDWPQDKLRVFILDDGRRAEMREFAASVGAGYMIRSDNKHAKAGNLNAALKKTDGQLIAIFDCDHMPTRSFLKTCVGWFLRDPKCAMLQTPHHFFSPDPFERNLGTFRRVPNEGNLFYGLIQDGNDFWNATFFCGSCAVLRREPLMEVGGIAVETVTEDAHTALKLHRLGYHTAYIHHTQAAGLATESLSAHVGQRIRWARGMAQIFRIDNPFLGKGLSFFQRICYANAMLHFLFGLPRLVFLTAPMAYLFFDLHIISASSVMLALYVLPYIFQSNIANAHVQGEFRHSFWAEVYETVLAWYVALPTTVALFNPKLGKFNVTAKGGLVERQYFDWNISTPYIALVVFNMAAAVMGVVRLLFLNPQEPATVLLNLVWTIYSLVILGAAIGVASESRQVRHHHRVSTNLTAVIYLPDGRTVHGQCTDYSMTGLGISGVGDVGLRPGEVVHVGLWRDDEECALPGEIISVHRGVVGIRLDHLSQAQQIDLVQCTFARPQAWQNWNLTHDQDRPMEGLKEIAQQGLDGYRKLGRSLWERWLLWRAQRRGLAAAGATAIAERTDA
jgi:cellulose synthase (UDP-forming)